MNKKGLWLLGLTPLLMFVVYQFSTPVKETPENGFLLGYELSSIQASQNPEKMLFNVFFKESWYEVIESHFDNPFEYTHLQITPKTHQLYEIIHFSWFPTNKEGEEFYNRVTAFYLASYHPPEAVSECNNILYRKCTFQLGDKELSVSLFTGIYGPDDRFTQYLNPDAFPPEDDSKKLTVIEILNLPNSPRVGRAYFAMSLKYSKDSAASKRIKRLAEKEFDDLVVESLSADPLLAPLTNSSEK